MRNRNSIVLAALAAVAFGWTVLGAADSQPASAPASSAWLTSMPKAVEEATKSGKLILIDFTGSDWCIWCKRLRAEVFETQEFKDWAAGKVVLLELDYPRTTAQDAATKKQNEQILKKYKIQGFPTVLFIKPDGTSVGQTGYVKGGPKPWIAEAQKILDAAAKAAPAK